MRKRQEPTCLHTSRDGEIWIVEAGGNPQPFLHLNNPLRLRAGNYRVMGCPANYRLITDLYSTLNRKEEESQVLIGSPAICRERNHTCKEILNCISVLTTHDSLSDRWHVLDSSGYNNYLLLRYFHEEGITDLVANVYKHHGLRNAFNFLGLNSLQLAVYLISEIVDPRWFLNLRRPYRLSKLESYFGLKPGQFHQLWRPATLPVFDLPDHQRRTVLLMEIVRALPTDGPIALEVQDEPEDAKQVLKMCRLVLGFVARHWLQSLGRPGYFDPERFFKKVGNQADYRRQFED